MVTRPVLRRGVGLNYNVNRDYEAATGRNIQSDPIGLGGGTNTYLYSAGRPLPLSDPLALSYAQQWAAGGAATGGLVGLASGIAGTAGRCGSNGSLIRAEVAGDALIGEGIGYAAGIIADWIVGAHGANASQSNPLKGTPGDTSWTTYPAGSPKQRHTYGDDGFPNTDIDYGHDHNGAGDPHAHD